MCSALQQMLLVVVLVGRMLSEAQFGCPLYVAKPFPALQGYSHTLKLELLSQTHFCCGSGCMLQVLKTLNRITAPTNCISAGRMEHQ